MVSKCSVLMSVYHKEKPEYLKQAIESIQAQTLQTDDFVLVCDGPLNDALDKVIAEKQQEMGMTLNVVRLSKNGGLGNALNEGVKHCKNELVARMDSDDICLPNRFELQLQYLEQHPEVDIIGGQMTEFIDTPDNIVGKRVVPCVNDEIYDFMKGRCALNHVTVMFRKEAVLKAGNYQDWFWNEDYYLWVRMMIAKCKFANVPDVLVNVRSGADQYARRGGRKYYESEKGIKKLQLDNKMITKKEYLYFVSQRYILQILMPNWLRGWVFRTFARKK